VPVWQPYYEIDESEYMNNKEYFDLARARGVAFRIRTAEETRLRAEAVANAQRRQQESLAKKQAILSRAKELLLEHLTQDQRNTFEKNRWFIVKGSKSKTEYRIRTDYGIAGNIDVLNKGQRVATLCCHCRYDIPESDQFLSQKLALMYDEENFLKVANRRAAA